MDNQRLRQVLEALAQGQSSVNDTMTALSNLPFEDVGFANVDTHRAVRTGFPEVVFCPGKTTPQIVEILRRLHGHGGVALATRADRSVYDAVALELPQAVYHEAARAITVGTLPTPGTARPVLVMTAGTADIAVAQEAALTVQCMGSSVDTLFDVGVAGIHRLLHHRPRLMAAGAIVVVAGMEGALPSVVAGLVDKPVIAVPTSVGYGAHLGGIAPLLTMLNSCAAGMAVVNIDNGFGAGHMAALINLQCGPDA